MAHFALSRANFFAVVLCLGLIACDPAGEDPSRDATAATLPTTHPDDPRFLGSLDPGYVGNAACVPCHGDVVQEYQRTNHGRSLTPFDPTDAPERFPSPGPPSSPESWTPSPFDGLHYRAELEDGRLVQREALVGAEGEFLSELRQAADRVIGSGNQTRSYLMIRNGRVTQMPLTWYSVREEWDMSPGYAEANDRFSRPIILACLTCHSDLPVREDFTQNVYREMPGSISCERCHGPGAEHAEARTAGEVPEEGGPDPWIVNPTHLERSRLMSTCNQCHLAGVMAHPDGEDATTFRPGMELTENRAVFVPALQLEDPDWVGIDSHPIRLARSACYQASEMTCITCHLPHTTGSELPEDHYRNRCVDCHTLEDPAHTLCSRPEAATPEEAASGDCVSCHMSSGGTSDVPHVRFTDHWIQRVPRPPLPPEAGRPVIESPRPLRILEVGPMGTEVDGALLIHRSAALQASLRADALFHFYETMHRHPGYLPQVVGEGRSAEGVDPAFPGDGPSQEGRLALARALLQMDSVQAAEGILEAAVRLHPEDAWGHFLLGGLLEERRGRALEAVPHLRRAVQLQPRFLEARVKLAEALYAAGDAGEARDELEAVLEEDPLHRPSTWFNLGVLRLEAGDVTGAEEAFSQAARLDPMNAEAHIQVGSLLMARGGLEEAGGAFRAAVAADPSHPGGHGSLALVLLEQGRPEEARERLERVLELDPGNEAARELLRELGGR